MFLSIYCLERELRALEANQGLYCVRFSRYEAKSMSWREFAHLAVLSASRKHSEICTREQKVRDTLLLICGQITSNSKDGITVIFSALTKPSKNFRELLVW
jgi:hypothetical protein